MQIFLRVEPACHVIYGRGLLLHFAAGVQHTHTDTNTIAGGHSESMNSWCTEETSPHLSGLPTEADSVHSSVFPLTEHTESPVQTHFDSQARRSNDTYYGGGTFPVSVFI